METCYRKTPDLPLPELLDALAAPAGRRWLRRTVLPRLAGREAAFLAAALLAYRDDFSPMRRDPSTWVVVDRLDRDTLAANVDWLAGSNAALAVWERAATEGIPFLVSAALRVLRRGTPLAREVAVTLLLADPTRELRLPPGAERALLRVALADPDEVVRGLAAEVAAQRAPDLVLADWRWWVRAPSQRARRAVWQRALRHDPEARDVALALLADEAQPVAVRCDALRALARSTPTAELAPILALLVQHPERELAETAAELLWSEHRHPLPAHAALASPHPAVREVGARLLDPRRGSPAAGGARPGMPTLFLR
ncbi:MAG: hypothetical protein RMK01_08880 [Thermomicrobium sp.]|nr:hypothetical protein [Thermomicrobium sp.]MDW8060174.1 hypothetical protein [Thermomicrobium sp.]